MPSRTRLPRTPRTDHLRLGQRQDASERSADALASRLAGRRVDSGAQEGPDAATRALPSALSREILATRGGSPVPRPLADRASAVGVDTSDVRVHSGTRAQQLSAALSAHAFTSGRDVFLGRGATVDVLSHEVAHAVQGTAEGVVRRWQISSLVDVADATRVSTISSGQAVFFLRDKGGEDCVVKADASPGGINAFAGLAHRVVSKVDSPAIAELPSGQKQRLAGVLKDGRRRDATSFAGLYAKQTAEVDDRLQSLGLPATGSPAEKAALFQASQVEEADKRLLIMGKAKGRTMRDLASPGGSAGPRRASARRLLDDADHVRALGRVTATDIFLGNIDRTFSGNLGNWLIDKQGKISTIDNADHNVKNNLLGADPTDPWYLDKLYKANIAKTAQGCVQAVVDAMDRDGDTTVHAWFAMPVAKGTRSTVMTKAFLDGLTEGRKDVVKRFATKKMGTRGRALKAAAQRATTMDRNRGAMNAPEDYWEVLKRRARLLQKN